jgi:endonuclease/exonuclease/phosphatase family metal-dependent hydrolase
MACDVWLLTEVSDRLAIASYHLHRSEALMAPRRHWAAIATRLPMSPVSDPHRASAMASVEGLTVCSSILPCRACGNGSTWVGDRHAEKAEATLHDLDGSMPRATLIWGGDWNHALSGREYSGSMAGRQHIQSLLDDRGMQVPTSSLPHRIDGLLSIDHIAVTDDLAVESAERFRTPNPGGGALSDHDGYVVTIRSPSPG